jgi:class 3 adenylate cyclase
MPRLQAKSFETPDEIRDLPQARFVIVKLDEVTVGRSTFEPGWRWSTDLGPMVGTATCQIRHLGYTISGSLRAALDDGQTIDIGPNTVYEIPPGHDAWVLGDEPWVTIEWTSGRAFDLALDDQSERVIATVLFTDIVDSTETLAKIGDAAWRELLLNHNSRIREELNAFRGREIATTGDGFLAVFDSATRAVRCAAAMTRATRALGLPIRVGVHTGEVEFVGGEARGVAVHAAARVMSLAGPDEVIVSSTTRDLLEGSGLVLEDAGSHELKGLSGSRQVYRVVSPAEA